MNTAEINAMIATFTTNRNELRSLGHTIAIAIVLHAAPLEVGFGAEGTGDCTTMKALHEAMPKSWAAQLNGWLGAFSPIRVANKNVGYDPKYKKLKIEPDMTDEQKADIRAERLLWWKLEEAAITPFYEFKEPTPVDVKLNLAELIKMVERLANKLEKSADDDKVEEGEILTAKALAAQLRSIKVQHVEAVNNSEVMVGGQNNVQQLPQAA